MFYPRIRARFISALVASLILTLGFPAAALAEAIPQPTAESAAPATQGASATPAAPESEPEGVSVTENSDTDAAAPVADQLHEGLESPATTDTAQSESTTPTQKQSSADSTSGAAPNAPPAPPADDQLAPVADDQPAASAIVTKDVNTTDAIAPGDTFNYQFFVGCNGAVDCVGLTFTDTFPAEIQIDTASFPSSSATRQVEWDEATRTLTITFTSDLGGGNTGMPTGSADSYSFDISASLPLDTALADGASVTNTASVSGDNVEPGSHTSDDASITVSIPRSVVPVANKTWSPAAGFAGSDAQSTVSLTLLNQSSSSTHLSELSVVDEDADTFEYFDASGVTVTAFPQGANRATLWAKATDQTWSPVTTLTAPGSFAWGATNPATVVGVRVTFDNSTGAELPRETGTGGGVDLALTLRDDRRSDGASIAGLGRAVTVDNTAYGTGEDDEGLETGSGEGASYTINPITTSINFDKTFVPDENGDWNSNNADEVRVAYLGGSSGVTSIVSARNTSKVTIDEITITDPDGSTEWNKVDWSKARIRVPNGATATVTFQPGNVDVTYLAGTHEVAPLPVTDPTSVTATFADVPPNAVVGLDLHGAIDDSATTVDDVVGGSDAGINNCAVASGGNTNDGSGTFQSKDCATVAYWASGETGVGVGKSASQTSIPPGQVVRFPIEVQNWDVVPRGNIVLNDTRVNASGTPIAGSDPEARAWEYLDLVAVELRDVPASVGTATIEVYQNGAWVPFVATNAPLDIDALQISFDGELNPRESFTLIVSAQMTDGAPVEWSTSNCVEARGSAQTADGTTQRTRMESCVELNAGPPSTGSTVNVSIDKESMHASAPGMQPETSALSIRAGNTGNVDLSSLEVATSGDFFNGFELTGYNPSATTLPAGADAVQVDVYLSGCGSDGWVTGTPSATGALPTLPAGCTLANVTQVRALFTSADGISPCEGQQCVGAIGLTVSPRATTEPGDYTLNAVGRAVSTTGIETSAPATHDTVTLELGEPVVSASKTIDRTSQRPGDTASATLTLRNDGTAGALSPVLVDALPAGMDMVDATDFTWSVDGLPEGYDAAPTPTVSTSFDEEGKLDRISFRFAGWTLPVNATITVTVNGLTLAPGVQAGDTIENRLGASTEYPEPSCAAGTTQAADGEYGADGVWCETTDSVVVGAGSAFQARKWAGSAEATSWFNSATGSNVTPGDASCPTITRDGISYTRTPCVVVVSEGDAVQWLLQSRNAGTEFASRVTIYDNLPTSGDAGALGATRGSQWNGVVSQVSAPGATVSTSDSAVTCDSTAMRHNQSGCGSTWRSGTDGQALRLDWQLDEGSRLAPGEGVEAVVTTVVPAMTGQSGLLTATNTFGHVETTYNAQTGGSARYLPGFESNSASAATSWGTFEVAKLIGDNPAAVATDSLEFDVSYTCTEPSGRESAGDGVVTTANPWRSPVLPEGTECSVWESGTQGGQSSASEENPVNVTIVRDVADVAGVDVTITNDFAAARLMITPEVTGAGGEEFGNGPFSYTVTCTFNGVTVLDRDDVSVAAGDSADLGPLPVGAECEVIQTDAAGADRSSGHQTVAIGTDGAVAEFTNEFGAGTIAVSKTLSGEGSQVAGGLGLAFPFQVQCVAPDGETVLVDAEVVVAPGETVTVTEDGDPVLLPLGTSCWATESNLLGAASVSVMFDSAENSIAVTSEDLDVVAGAVIAAVNQFDVRTLTITSEVENGEHGTDGPFDVAVVCTAELDGEEVVVAQRSVQLSNGQSAQVVVLSGADCVVTQTDVDGGVISYTTDGEASDGSAMMDQARAVVITTAFQVPVEPTQVSTPEPTTTPEPAATTSDSGTPGPRLPSTGASVGGLLAAAGLLLALGWFAVALRRRTQGDRR